jgi:L-threonylcarbamoyladenylate synthase
VGKLCRDPAFVSLGNTYQSRGTAVNAHEGDAPMSIPLEREARALREGGLVVYPTETFYALGCLATLHGSVERVVMAKGRPDGKPLPLIIADWDMAERFLSLRGGALSLARKFWPGPLSIIVETAPDVSPLAKDGHGRSAVRMSPHPLATRLCAEAGGPLVSSSANLSGRPPACRPEDLDLELLRNSGALVLDAQPWPAGGLPSTLVELVDEQRVRIVRAGAVPVGEIVVCGFEIGE